MKMKKDIKYCLTTGYNNDRFLISGIFNNRYIRSRSS